MARINISCDNLQSLFANISHNTVDFTSYLQSTLLLSKQVESFIQNTFQSIGLDTLNIPSIKVKESFSPQVPSPSRVLQPKNITQNPHKSIPSLQQKEGYLPQLYVQKEAVKPNMRVIPSYEAVKPMVYQDFSRQVEAKRRVNSNIETVANSDDQYFMRKKAKVQAFAFETDSYSTSEGSPDNSRLKVKLEEVFPERKEASLVDGDKPVKINGLKMDKSTKTTYYLVEWQTRKSGFKPKESYVRREDILKEHGHLVAIFFESQLITRMDA